MIKKIIQHGNSSAVILDKPIMELLDIDGETLLEMSTDGTSIILSPVRNKDRQDRLDSALDRINKKHVDTLSKLSK